MEPKLIGVLFILLLFALMGQVAPFAPGTAGDVVKVEDPGKLSLSGPDPVSGGTGLPGAGAPGRDGVSPKDGRETTPRPGKSGGRIAGHLVVIDPGHGGTDTGAVAASGLYEKDVNLAVSLLLAGMLQQDGAAVILTRPDDEDVTLAERAEIANRSVADLFVSVHGDSHTDPTKSGFTVYYSSAEGAVLAKAVHNQMRRQLSIGSLGMRTADFYVLNNTWIPAVLVEVAFLSNPSEAQLLANPAFQKRAATAILRGIEDYLRRR